MTSQLAVLMEKMRSVEAEIEAELAKRQEALRFRFESDRIVFEEEAQRIHRAIKTRISRYLLDANPLIVLTAPVIYSVLIPILLLDIFVIAYEAICFNRLMTGRRRAHLLQERFDLAQRRGFAVCFTQLAVPSPRSPPYWMLLTPQSGASFLDLLNASTVPCQVPRDRCTAARLSRQANSTRVQLRPITRSGVAA
jgi:hypothetical protein